MEVYTAGLHRRIIQIAMSESSDSENGGNRTLLALCDDGTLWELVTPSGPDDKPRWVHVLPIPNR